LVASGGEDYEHTGINDVDRKLGLGRAAMFGKSNCARGTAKLLSSANVLAVWRFPTGEESKENETVESPKRKNGPAHLQ